jgi:hypothetical protein
MNLPRAAALGTMHGKEAALAPPLARLGIALLVPAGLDTDRFGTFTGEVPRAGTMADAARAKATAAMVATGLPHGLASEGAYGPHPALPLVAAGLELVLWRDAERGAEVVETLADDRPACDQAEVSDAAALAPFLRRVSFPQTALVVAPRDAPLRPVAKGLRDAGALAVAVRAAADRSTCGHALVQTDMRAHMNPRRMQTIGRLAARLARRLATPCPACGAPGWGRLRTVPGLPCSACGAPSILVRHEVHGCAFCGAEEIRPRADGLTQADPGCCPSCNP